MKKILVFILAAAVTFIFSGLNAWAQESATGEFMLEEITVTAEKRASNLQDLPSSVVALPGDDLLTQGKVTTDQILESVPNITFRDGGGTNPNGNIAVRGIQRTQESGGTNDVLPATTAVYVDGIYQGIGGNYDIDRVEVLRGPQGTLYGRSATGGVVAFHTKNPDLDAIGASASIEVGSDNLRNYQAMLNVPYNDELGLRLAWHDYERDGYFDPDGGHTKTSEGRIKALWRPDDAFEVLLSGSLQRTVNWGGGYKPTLIGPDEIDYEYETTWSVPEAGAAQKYRQLGLEANYDFGESTLTYIQGFHDYDYTGLGAEGGKGESLHRDQNDWPTDYYHTEEIRWASDTEGMISWLVGANYFRHEFDTSIFSVQTGWAEDPELPGDTGFMVPIWGRSTNGTFKNFGFFTEETFEVTDDFRITAGLRYDKTKLIQDVFFYSNNNLTALGNSMNPPVYDSASLNDDKHDYDNTTYKLRLEYDLTPDSMIYALTATGFMPGYVALSPQPFPPPVQFQLLQLEQQELTSYELGSKNQFLNNTLRLNAALFFYDYEGYPEAVNLRYGGGPPTFTVIPVPLEVKGLELDGEYLITMNDKLSFSFGYMDIEITELPETVQWTAMSQDVVTTPGSDAIMLTELPGNPPIKATLAYDHTFSLPDGSTLVPRGEVLYTGDYYLSQMNFIMDGRGPDFDTSQKPYNNQDAYTVFNAGITWTMANQMLSVTGWVRNAFDEEYKAGVGLNKDSMTGITVTPGDPQTFGVILSAKY